MSNKNIVEKSILFVKSKFDSELNAGYTYHNFQHTMWVYDGAIKLAEKAKLTDEDQIILELAAIFHDVGFVVDPDQHELESTKIATQFLNDNAFDSNLIEEVTECILATKMGSEAKSQLEQLIQDADLSGLANDSYSDICENLRKELVFRHGKKIKKKQWIKENIQFLSDHQYKSPEGKELFESAKKKNLKMLNDMAAKKEKPVELLTIGSSKSAQTQLKTALRNHIDLSSIADNKANIMLSVNAIVITVGLPLILERMASNEKLLIPMIILAIASLGSMIFATLSTRPAKMYGETKPQQILDKKSNLFFFGNYYNMSFDEYEEGMRTVVANNEILDNSITRDLFFLGKSLGKKYEYLRYCYNIFMYGIAAAIIAYAVVSIL